MYIHEISLLGLGFSSIVTMEWTILSLNHLKIHTKKCVAPSEQYESTHYDLILINPWVKNILIICYKKVIYNP